MRKDNFFEKLRNRLFGTKIRYKKDNVHLGIFKRYLSKLDSIIDAMIFELNEYVDPINKKLNERNLKIVVTLKWSSDMVNDIKCREIPSFENYCESFITVSICKQHINPYSKSVAFYVNPIMCTFCKIVREYKYPQFYVILLNLELESSHDAFYRSIDNMVAEAFEKLRHNN